MLLMPEASISATGHRLEGINAPWLEARHLGKEQAYAPGESLQVRGCRYFHLLTQGSISMNCLNADGTEWGMFRAHRYCFANDIPAITQIDNHVAYVCQGAVKTIRFESALLFDKAFYAQFPELILNLMQSVGYKLSFFYFYALNAKNTSALERVCAILSQLTQGQAGIFALGVGQKDIGAQTGLHPTSVARAIRRLRAERIIGDFTKHRLEVLKPAELQKNAKKGF